MDGCFILPQTASCCPDRRLAQPSFFCRLRSDVSDRAEIEQLAALVGIEARYTDTFGNIHKVSDETLLALIAVLGLPPDPTLARQELGARQRQAPLGVGPVH